MIHLVVRGLLVLLVEAVQTARGSCNITQVQVNGLCCDQCPPGSIMAGWCNADTPTRCEPCPQRTYKTNFNLFTSCLSCTRCIEGLRQVEIEDCTSTRNRQCGCAKDESITRLGEGGTLFWCCPNCPAGTEALKECSYEDFVTPCSACPPWTFSDGRGAPCRNCTRCDIETSPCTNTSDAICMAIDVSANGTVITLTAAVAGSVLLSAAAVLMILRRRRASVAKTNLPPSRGASSSLECSTRGSSQTLQHEKEKDLENPLNPDKCDALSISSSVSSGIEVDMSESVPFSQTLPRNEVS